MTAAPLERSYRRLLACYPAGHREAYGDEMLGVLLAAAPPGQRRPGFADALDLFGGAARVRLRALLTGPEDPGWRNALALTSLLAPFLLLLLSLRQNLLWLGTLTWPGGGTGFGFVGAAILLVPVALGLLGLRHVGAIAAVATVAWFAIHAAAVGGPYPDPRLAAYQVLIAIQALALAVSPGPRTALRLISRRGLVMALPWVAAVAYTGGLIPTSYPVPQVVARIVIVGVAIAGLPALITPAGRRLIVLIAAIPGAAFVVTLLTFANVQFYEMSYVAAMFSLYLPPAAVAVLAYLAARRSRRGSTPPHVGAAA